MKRLVNYLLISVLLVQCTDDERQEFHSPDFFPLAVGKYWIYSVEETTFSPLQAPIADTSQLMVHVADSFVNSEQGITYVLHRYTRQHESLPWEFTETWSARITDQFVIVQEGNVPTIPLAFPIQVNRSWNANRYNNQPEDEYRITQLVTGPSVPVDVVAEVTQENVAANLTYRDVRIENYAIHIGLISKLSEVWSYTCTGGSCTGTISSGYKRVQHLQEYGTL